MYDRQVGSSMTAVIICIYDVERKLSSSERWWHKIKPGQLEKFFIWMLDRFNGLWNVGEERPPFGNKEEKKE